MSDTYVSVFVLKERCVACFKKCVQREKENTCLCAVSRFHDLRSWKSPTLHTVLINWKFFWLFTLVFFFLCGCLPLMPYFSFLSLFSSLWYSPGKLDSPTHWPHGPPWKTRSLWVAKYICSTHSLTHTHILKLWVYSYLQEDLLSPQCQLIEIHTNLNSHLQTKTHTHWFTLFLPSVHLLSLFCSRIHYMFVGDPVNCRLWICWGSFQWLQVLMEQQGFPDWRRFHYWFIIVYFVPFLY